MSDKNSINKNKKIFEMTNEKYQVYTPKLVEFLGESLFTAPASTSTSLHNAYDGGLMDHLIRVAKKAAMFNESLLEEIKYSKETILKISFLCEIGKVYQYKPCESEWHRKNQGKMYEFIEDNISMRVGERSLFYALYNGVILTEEESQAILNFDKKESDDQSYWHSQPLTDILRSAVKFAIIEEKHTNNG